MRFAQRSFISVMQISILLNLDQLSTKALEGQRVNQESNENQDPSEAEHTTQVESQEAIPATTPLLDQTQTEVPAPSCDKCNRPLSASTGTCYYCREVPKEMEMDIKLKMVEMERDEQARNKADHYFFVSKVLSAIVGVIFLYCVLSKYFTGVSITFLSVFGLMFLVNSWTLDRNLLKTMSFCVLCSAVAAVYSLSLAIPFMIGEGRNLMLMFSASFLAVLSAVPGLIVVYLVEKDRRA